MDQKFEKAVRFISDSLKDDPGADIPVLVESASVQFDLNPDDTDKLYALYRKKEA